MKRSLPAATLLLAFYGLTIRPASGQDQVYYRLPTAKDGKELQYEGKIKAESARGVTITVGRDDKVVAALDIVQVAYKTQKTGPSDYRGPDGNVKRGLESDPKTKAKERRDYFKKALKDFSDLAAQDLKDSPFAVRYVQYRIAFLNYRMALDDGQQAQAIKALEDYTAANPGGWQILVALKDLSRLYEDTGNIDKAGATLARLADLPDVPRDIKREGDQAVSQLLMRSKRFDEAERRLKSLFDSLPLGDPQRARTQVLLVQSQVAQKKTDGAEKQLKDAISGTGDPLLRGIAYNVLGDYYREKGQTEDAFWAYLRVDAMYNADAAEHAKAIYYLSELFKEKKFGDRTGDPGRAKNYRERLLDKRFGDTEYQKKIDKP
jgi:tetratricopeptide (TPR) repeat protein